MLDRKGVEHLQSMIFNSKFVSSITLFSVSDIIRICFPLIEVGFSELN